MEDILFIGSGAATTTTMIELLGKMIAKPADKLLQITVVEKYQEFWKGIPYGSRSSVNSLTITSISDFISGGKEKELFFSWLKANQKQWISQYQQSGGMAAKVWLEENLPLVNTENWALVYLPRFIFGLYMDDKMQRLLKTVKEKRLAKITLIQAEAIDIKKENNNSYKLTLEHPDKVTSTIVAKKLVVAIGSAPVKAYAVNDSKAYTYINEMYKPSLDESLATLKNKFLAVSNPEERNLLVIGSNASSIELMYILNHRPDLLDIINCIVAISQTGIMPYHISDKRYEAYPCANLDAVKAAGNYNIHTLLAATKQDIVPAVKFGVIIPYVDRVIGYTIELMQILDDDAKKIFFGVYGPQLTRLIRRSGPAYKGSAVDLITKQKLQLLQGRFEQLEQANHGAILKYTDTNGEAKQYDEPFKVIINCAGSDDLQDSSSRLISSLVKQKLCAINLSRKGFLVNESFEAAPNLYIMGPLLGGNMNNRIHFWHLENVARLLYLSPLLADELLSQ